MRSPCVSSPLLSTVNKRVSPWSLCSQDAEESERHHDAVTDELQQVRMGDRKVSSGGRVRLWFQC
jgi:hypothetical protein